MPDAPDQARLAIGWIATAILAYLAYLVVRPLLAPVAWAAIIAILFHPVFVRLRGRWSAGRAAAATTVLASLVVIVPVSMIATAFVNEMFEAVRGLQTAITNGRFGWLEQTARRLLQFLPAVDRPDLGTAAVGAAQRGAMTIVSYSGLLVRNLVTVIFELVFALFASFFLLRDSSAILRTLQRLMPLDDRARDKLILDTAELVGVSVRSSLVVAAIQGVLGGCVFAAVGIDAPVFWGVIMAFFCVLPFGAWVVWLPAAVLLAAAGEIGRAALVVVLGVAIVSGVDNFLRPVLLSGRTAMNGLLVFIGLFGGVAAFGAIGLVLGPVLIATATTTLTTYAESQPSTSLESRPREG